MNETELKAKLHSLRFQHDKLIDRLAYNLRAIAELEEELEKSNVQ